MMNNETIQRIASAFKQSRWPCIIGEGNSVSYVLNEYTLLTSCSVVG